MSAETMLSETLAKDATTTPSAIAPCAIVATVCIDLRTFRVPTKTFAMFSRHLNTAMVQFREDVEIRTARDVKLRVGTINPVGEYALVSVGAYGRL